MSARWGYGLRRRASRVRICDRSGGAKRWITSLPLALLLAGCAGNITFRRVDLAFMVEDEKARYNAAAGLVNRACLAHALSAEDCQASADAGKEAVKAYANLKKSLLAKETVTADAIIQWLLVIGTAIAHAYGIPLPTPAMASPHPAPVATLPLMP